MKNAPRNHTVLAMTLSRKAGRMHDRRQERGGAKNTKAELLADLCSHVEDNQGLCHNCGELLNLDRWQAYVGKESVG